MYVPHQPSLKWPNSPMQICKYPSKVKKRKHDLSTEEYASSQAPRFDAHNDEDNYSFVPPKPYPPALFQPATYAPRIEQSRSSSRIASGPLDGWMKSVSEDTARETHSNVITRMQEPTPASNTMSDAQRDGDLSTVHADHGFSSLKRAGSSSLGPAKKLKKPASDLYNPS
jgi:hypothetical protein